MTHKAAPKLNEKIQTQIANKEKFFSFEFFPPKTPEGNINLFNRFDRMALFNPLFIDVTWSAGGKSCKNDRKTLDIAHETQDYCCLTVNMHLTCNTSTKAEICEVLDNCRDVGITNILALRGDPPLNNPDFNENEQEMKHAVDLVKLMREKYGDYFCISVAGYPYGHPDCDDKSKDLQHLKEKVDAGSDFVISQLFFDAEDFLIWVKKCREIGIECPILPGVLPIQGYKSLQNIAKMCSVPIPSHIVDTIEKIKDDDSAVKAFGIKYAVEMCKKLLEGGVVGLHFYTLNQETATLKIIEQLGLVSIKEFPWRKSVAQGRGKKEETRPIYWANRFKSYLSRTSDWDEFPNGRWGDVQSPAYGELTDYHIFLHHKKVQPQIYMGIWGEKLSSDHDISKVFIEFLNGKIEQLPWIDYPVQPETNTILKELIDVNQDGFWTINSQPRVNGALSTDPNVGWGGPGGILYQKAYLEFFCSPENVAVFLEVVKQFTPRFSYQAVNMKGDYISNVSNTLTVTWGVFPGKQILQPTIVDPVSLKAWKIEAFNLWLSKWGVVYEKDSESRNVIQNIYDNYYLVNVVDNDFINGNLFDVFEKIKALKISKALPN